MVMDKLIELSELANRSSSAAAGGQPSFECFNFIRFFGQIKTRLWGGFV
jgi:hypothetical protein